MEIIHFQLLLSVFVFLHIPFSVIAFSLMPVSWPFNCVTLAKNRQAYLVGFYAPLFYWLEPYRLISELVLTYRCYISYISHESCCTQTFFYFFLLSILLQFLKLIAGVSLPMSTVENLPLYHHSVCAVFFPYFSGLHDHGNGLYFPDFFVDFQVGSPE